MVGPAQMGRVLSIDGWKGVTVDDDLAAGSPVVGRMKVNNKARWQTGRRYLYCGAESTREAPVWPGQEKDDG